ncbi:MAG: hypothetical protein U0939_14855 [Pirellulales bacterium]
MNQLANIDDAPQTLSPAPSPAPPPAPSEAVPLAQELARAHGRLVAQFQSQYGLTPADAAKKAEGMVNADAVERHLSCPTEAISWNALDAVARHDPARAVEVWEGIKAEAGEELATGHRAARVVETGDANCMTRARFLAIRDELMRDWRPTTGQERLLIDTMARALTTEEHWHHRMMLLDALENDEEEPSGYKAPRLPMAAAIDQAANLMDRFNRIYMRALRQLRDLRRYTPQVVVKNASQVNVGGNQMNVDLRSS